MNFKRRCEFTDAIKDLNTKDLIILLKWLMQKENEADKEDKIELLDIELRGREKLSRRIESL